MDVALRASIRRTFGVAVVVTALGVGYVAHGVAGSPSARPTATHAPAKLTASNLLRAAATATAGIYMQFDGVTPAPGLKYTGYPKMSSFQFGVGRGATISGGTRAAGTPSVSEITLTHQTDKFSAPLLQQSLTGDGSGNAVVYFTNLNVGGNLVNYLEFDLGQALVTGFSLSSGGDVPSESLSLNFTSITMIAHIAGSPPQTVTYNLL